ncbi:MAG: hypothetical protein AB7K63_03035 [Vicinamibacterales bacterium]
MSRGSQMLQLFLIVHVAGATVALFAGMTAMAVAKGGFAHRRAGAVFAIAMLTMCGSALIIAVARAQSINIVAATLTAYLVATALTTLRSPTVTVRRLDRGLMLTALTAGVAAAATAAAAAGPYRAPLLMFALLGVLGAVGDFKALRAVRLAGAPRLSRHLWRMSLAMLIATMSFFLGPRGRVEAVLPDVLATTPVLMLPVLAVLLTMFSWLYRVHGKALPAVVSSAPEGADEEACVAARGDPDLRCNPGGPVDGRRR